MKGTLLRLLNPITSAIIADELKITKFTYNSDFPFIY